VNSRTAQREATRARLVETGVELLIARGYSGTNTLAVQKAAGVSRGALLHHFPTRADLLTAVIRRLLEMHEAAAREALSSTPPSADPVTRAITALNTVIRRPAYVAQMDLWTAARTDPGLARVVSREERRAGSDLARVVDDLFGRPLTEHPRYRAVAGLTVQILRGLALTDVLRGDAETARRALDDWTAMVHDLLGPTEEPQ
jgi:AcrR family transcriptional regulator